MIQRFKVSNVVLKNDNLFKDIAKKHLIKLLINKILKDKQIRDAIKEEPCFNAKDYRILKADFVIIDGESFKIIEDMLSMDQLLQMTSFTYSKEELKELELRKRKKKNGK